MLVLVVFDVIGLSLPWSGGSGLLVGVVVVDLDGSWSRLSRDRCGLRVGLFMVYNAKCVLDEADWICLLGAAMVRVVDDIRFNVHANVGFYF